jgi:hypothetical protein
MKLSTCLLSFGLLFCPCSFAQEIPESPSADIGYPNPDAALKALRDKPGVTIREQNDWIVLSDTAEHTIWSITSDRHAAHPTVVKRAFVERDGGVNVAMTILCGSSKETCDRVVRQFQELNDNVRSLLVSRPNKFIQAEPASRVGLS